MIDIALIGTGGMIPLHNRFLSSMAARLNGSILLIDCGEGTQITLCQLGWGFKNLDYICITHFHADHIAGLPGLLLTVGNSGRTEPLIILGAEGIRGVAEHLRVIAPELPFEIKYIELPSANTGAQTSYILGKYNITALNLDHRINCFGYALNINRSGKFDANRATEQKIPLKFWSRLQNGETIKYDSKIYTPDMVTGPARKGIKVAYITDTRPTDSIPDFIYGADLFICEGLYGDDEKRTKAAEHKHMVFSEAAGLAKKGNVKELWLTHYSPAMTIPDDYLEIAKNIFPNTRTGYDRMTTNISFDKE
ncbi:MAG: ribonuclease Z [Oscillospiraceae bacterium]|nr:ribonuclease Z [Oscillospiraceae bacterium]